MCHSQTRCFKNRPQARTYPSHKSLETGPKWKARTPILNSGADGEGPINRGLTFPSQPRLGWRSTQEEEGTRSINVKKSKFITETCKHFHACKITYAHISPEPLTCWIRGPAEPFPLWSDTGCVDVSVATSSEAEPCPVNHGNRH
jgi:hypothetical protein